jgi:hypothetical protein
MTRRGTFTNDEIPTHWNLLTPEDQSDYLHLRQQLDAFTVRTSRDRVATQFKEIITKIVNYCLRNNEDDWKRFLVCGLVWLQPEVEIDHHDGAFALSTRQLCKLVQRCKSSINAGFQSIGYVTTSTSLAHTSAFLRIFPTMRNNMEEMRQWTIRGLVAGCCPFPIPSATENPHIDSADAEDDANAWLDAGWGDDMFAFDF